MSPVKPHDPAPRVDVSGDPSDRRAAVPAGVSEEACGCCGAPSRPPAIIDYIGRGLARRRLPPLPVGGDARVDREGRRVRFTLGVAEGVITAVAFEVTSCVTLIAYCERLAEIVTGLPLDRAGEHTDASVLAADLPQVPPYKRNLSQLAAAGLRSALRHAIKGATR